MKALIYFVLAIFCYLSFIGSAIWAVASFIVYLVKDLPFDYISIWCLIGSIVIIVIACVLGIIHVIVYHKR